MTAANRNSNAGWR